MALSCAVTETYLGELKPFLVGGSFVTCPRQKRYAYMLDNLSYWSIVIDGREGRKFREVPRCAIAFSDDSKHIAYAGETSIGMEIFVDGSLMANYNGRIASPLIFSLDSRHLAFVAETDGIQSISIDGRMGAGFYGAGSPCFSPDSSRIAFYHSDEKGRCKAAVWRLSESTPPWLGGKSQDTYPADPLSESASFFDGIADSSLIFSPDSKRLAFVAGISGGMAVAAGDRVGRPCAGIARGSLRFSGDSRHFAYIAHDYTAGIHHFIKDDSVLSTFNGDISETAVSPDLSRFAYIVKQAEQTVLAVNGDAVYTARFPEELLCPTFSPDSLHFAYVTRKSAHQAGVVVDGAPGEQYDGVLRPGICFTNSGEVAYLARLHTGESGLVVGDQVVSTFDSAPSNSFFIHGGTVRLIAERRNGLYQIEAEISRRL